jgi:hypothetical protein
MDKKEALKAIKKEKGFCLLLRVNHEEDAYEMSEVECEYQNRVYDIEAEVQNEEEGSIKIISFKEDSGIIFSCS